MLTKKEESENLKLHLIQSVGGFDRVFIDGSLLSMPPCGITLRTSRSFEEALEESHLREIGLAKLRVNIVGEIDTKNPDIEPRDLEELRRKLSEQSLKVVKAGRFERYSIANVGITIVKGDDLFLNEDLLRLKSEVNLERIAQKGDEADLLIAATRLAKYIEGIQKLGSVSVAIIDKIYVYRAYRGYGIASWIHSNIWDIIKTFSLTVVRGILLSYSDYKFEAGYYNVSTDEYVRNLHNHYLKNGYNDMTEVNAIREGLSVQRIMYKINKD